MFPLYLHMAQIIKIVLKTVLIFVVLSKEDSFLKTMSAVNSRYVCTFPFNLRLLVYVTTQNKTQTIKL